MTQKRFILTLSCDDKPGIVAAVAGFLAEKRCNILESAQFGDFATGRFFMRTEFESLENSTAETLEEQFITIAEQYSMDWQLHDISRKPKLLIMVSKASHCLTDLLHHFHGQNPSVEIPAIVSNHPDLEPIAAQHSIPFHHVPISPETKAEQESKLLDIIDKHSIDLVVLARYMQILSPELCDKLQGRAINIHHSFLPGFKGANPYQQAYDRGVKLIGATAHYVTPDLDEGPIIEQEVQPVSHTHNPAALKQVGKDIESRVLRNAVHYHINQRILMNDSKTVVFN